MYRALLNLILISPGSILSTSSLEHLQFLFPRVPTAPEPAAAWVGIDQSKQCGNMLLAGVDSIVGDNGEPTYIGRATFKRAFINHLTHVSFDLQPGMSDTLLETASISLSLRH